MNSRNTSTFKRLGSEPIRVLLAGIGGQLAALGIAYMVYQVAVDQSTGNSWADLGASILAIYVYMPVVVVCTVLAMKLAGIPRWLKLGILSGAAQILPVFYLENFQLAAPMYFALGVVIAGLIALFAWYVDQRTPGLVQSAVLIILGILAANGVLYLAFSAYNDWSLAQERKAEVNDLKLMVGSLGFAVYLPTYFPMNNVLYKITPADESSIEILHAPKGLTFSAGQSGNPLLIINEFKMPKQFDPPAYCGPFAADTISAGPVSYPLPCKKVAQVGGTKVYFESPTSVYPPEYDYYLVIGGTEVTIEDTMQALTAQQLQGFVEGLKLTPVSGLPISLLQRY